MSNLDKAVEVLREAYREPSMSPVHACDIMADALEAAGLLAPDFANVTRLTVVGGAGRLFEEWGITNVAVVLQDDGRTLKIFYREGQGND